MRSQHTAFHPTHNGGRLEALRHHGSRSTRSRALGRPGVPDSRSRTPNEPAADLRGPTKLCVMLIATRGQERMI